MEWLNTAIKWFSGGSRQYHSLFHCMNNDTGWVAVTVTLDFAVACAYILIAAHWHRNQQILKNQAARVALGRMKNIFIFCGLCGYIFIPIKMFWPAWRLYDGFLVVLAYISWRYALDSRNLTVVYNALNKSDQLEADLADSRAESRRKTHFLNAVSHDLRTPLNGLLLQCNYASLSLDSGDTEEARRAIALAVESAQASAEMLNGFLELARLDWSEDHSTPTTFNLHESVEKIARTLAHEFETKGLALKINCDPGTTVHLDRMKLERILQNLLGNAAKFTEQGSVEIASRRSNVHFCLDIIDTGLGIPPIISPIFSISFTRSETSNATRAKGFGLGLSIARRLAAQLGGDISLESQVGRGSRFTIHLPIKSVQSVVPVAHGDISHDHYARVDHDCCWLKTTAQPTPRSKASSRSEAGDVIVAISLGEAHRAIGGPPFDAVILDLMLPDGRRRNPYRPRQGKIARCPRRRHHRRQ